VFPGKRYVDWDLPDPAAMSVDEVRQLRAEIESKVAAL
jgi:arsenate reductase